MLTQGGLAFVDTGGMRNKLYHGFRSQEQYQRVFDTIIDAIDYNEVGYVAVSYDAECGLINVDYDNVSVCLWAQGIVSWCSKDSLEQFDLYTLESLDDAASDIFEVFEETEYEYENEERLQID